MKKVRKVAVVMLMVFGAVSVGFGVEIPKYHDSNYQKLKAEMEEYDVGRECKGGGSLDEWCNLKNVIAFFDEIRATEIDVKAIKCGTEECRKWDAFYMAIKKVREMPRFKNDSAIYSYVKGDVGNNREKAYFRNEEGFWKSVFNEWERTKSDLEIDGARRGYWKKMAE